MTHFSFLVANDLILFTQAYYSIWLVFAADITRALIG